MSNRHMKRCSTLLIIREITTTVRYHVTPFGTAVINKSRNTSADEDVRKRDPQALLVGTQMAAATEGNSIEGPPKL